MSSHEKHVKTKEEDLEGHESSMKKHLTMKYNMKELRKLTEFEAWAAESLEDLIPNYDGKPVLEAVSLSKLSEDKRIKQMQKTLKPYIKDEQARDQFIEAYIERMNKLPANILESM